MLTRIVFSCLFWVIAARWVYAEVQILVPSVVPSIEYALEHIQIPTHDKWPKEGFDKLFAQLTESVKEAKIF